MTDEPTTARDVVATILDCAPSALCVEMLRDMALKSGNYSIEDQAMIVQAADIRLTVLKGR